ncbi:hypothetical protein HDZ31DRAFT_64582 [Schizophyllum fasciatum]
MNARAHARRSWTGDNLGFAGPSYGASTPQPAYGAASHHVGTPYYPEPALQDSYQFAHQRASPGMASNRSFPAMDSFDYSPFSQASDLAPARGGFGGAMSPAFSPYSEPPVIPGGQARRRSHSFAGPANVFSPPMDLRLPVGDPPIDFPSRGRRGSFGAYTPTPTPTVQPRHSRGISADDFSLPPRGAGYGTPAPFEVETRRGRRKSAYQAPGEQRRRQRRASSAVTFAYPEAAYIAPGMFNNTIKFRMKSADESGIRLRDLLNSNFKISSKYNYRVHSSSWRNVQIMWPGCTPASFRVEFLTTRKGKLDLHSLARSLAESCKIYFRSQPVNFDWKQAKLYCIRDNGGVWSVSLH